MFVCPSLWMCLIPTLSPRGGVRIPFSCVQHLDKSQLSTWWWRWGSKVSDRRRRMSAKLVRRGLGELCVCVRKCYLWRFPRVGFPPNQLCMSSKKVVSNTLRRFCSRVPYKTLSGEGADSWLGHNEGRRTHTRTSAQCGVCSRTLGRHRAKDKILVFSIFWKILKKNKTSQINFMGQV